jgi:hypothetical protein
VILSMSESRPWYRSGLNSIGFGNTVGSWSMCLIFNEPPGQWMLMKKERLNQIFGITSEPLAKCMPSYISSWRSACGIPRFNLVRS